MSLSSKHGPILAQHKIYAYVFKNRQKKKKLNFLNVYGT